MPSSEQALRDFIASEVPKLTKEIADEVVKQVSYARHQFSRYSNSKKAMGRGFTYQSKKTSCRKIQEKISDLVGEINRADLMLLDEMCDYTGDEQFRSKITGAMEELRNACETISNTVPRNISSGRPLDRIIYDWVINMARIYEELFKIKKVDHHIRGKFMKFLKCWSPDELPVYGDRLSPRTIKRILEFREFYKGDLRNTFTPAIRYSPKNWENTIPND
jgi:hypothetical protein